MKKRFSEIITCRGGLCGVAATVLLVLSLLPSLSPAASSSFTQILPDQFHQGWAREGQVALYNPENLFEHINGEAELYIPYGFSTLATAAYGHKARPDVRLVAEVYRMGSLLDAFGIYSNYRKPDYETVRLGAEGFASPTQLLFYQGQYFVKLQATGTTGLERETLMACARLISGNLPANASRPQELAILAGLPIVPKSERYLAQGLLGYAFFRRGFIAETKPEAGSVRVFLMEEESRETAGRAFEAYRAYLREEGQAASLSGAGDRRSLSAIDPLYGGVYLVQEDRLLLGAVRVKDQTAAARFITLLREKMAAAHNR